MKHAAEIQPSGDSIREPEFPFIEQKGGLTKGREIGFPISSKKIIPRKTEQDGIDHCFVGIPPVSRNKKLSEFRYESFRS